MSCYLSDVNTADILEIVKTDSYDPFIQAKDREVGKTVAGVAFQHAGISVVADRLYNREEWVNCFTHEMGHIFGYEHTGERCKSVMSETLCDQDQTFTELDLAQCKHLGYCP